MGTAERETTKRLIIAVSIAVDQALKATESLEAENAALKEALKQIAERHFDAAPLARAAIDAAEGR